MHREDVPALPNVGAMSGNEPRKLAVVTGASSGIGLELAKLFAADGYDVLIAAEDDGIHAAAKAGWLDYDKCRDESLLAIKRAGAEMILTYFAREVAEGLRG